MQSDCFKLGRLKHLTTRSKSLGDILHLRTVNFDCFWSAKERKGAEVFIPFPYILSFI